MDFFFSSPENSTSIFLFISNMILDSKEWYQPATIFTFKTNTNLEMSEQFMHKDGHITLSALVLIINGVNWQAFCSLYGIRFENVPHKIVYNVDTRWPRGPDIPESASNFFFSFKVKHFCYLLHKLLNYIMLGNQLSYQNYKCFYCLQDYTPCVIF